MDTLATKRVSGIDEAGYGPLLGPLVLARADFAVVANPDGTAPRRVSRGVRVGDSKKVYPGKNGLARLERTVLGYYLAKNDRLPATLRDWLDQDLMPGRVDRFDALPWYSERDLALPLAATREQIDAAAESIRAVADRERFEGFRLAVVAETEFNERAATGRNKHEALFDDVCSLIGDRASGDAAIVVDKLGGRDRYGEMLEGAFPFVTVTMNGERRTESRYTLWLPAGVVDLRFMMKADAKAHAVSLASMAAKYTREALMTVFNAYWRKRAPGVAPTAGYYVDGCRFVEELAAAGALDVASRARMIRRR